MHQETTTQKAAHVERIASPHIFYRNFAPLGLAAEAAHGLMLALCTTLRSDANPYKDPTLLIVRDEMGRACGAAMRTPPHPHMLFSHMPAEAAQVLARQLVDMSASMGGLHGPMDVGNGIVDELARLTGRRLAVTMELVCYELTSLIEVPKVPGHARLAQRTDRARIVQFVDAFHRETGAPTSTTSGEWFDRMCASRNLLVWEDGGQLVAMAGTSGETPNGQRVVAVFVPEDQRGRGYASAITATASRAIFQAGKRLCFLYSEANNPVPNRMYQRLGYKPIGRFANWELAG